MPVRLEIEGLDELRQRFGEAPAVLDREINESMKTSLGILWENVPEYPPKKNPEQTYIRTGILGKSIGVDMNGRKLSQPPSIYTVQREGKYQVGTFGTNLEYAPHVIGDGTQAQHHRGHWWTMKTIAQRAVRKIEQEWQNMVRDLSEWLDGRRSKP